MKTILLLSGLISHAQHWIQKAPMPTHVGVTGTFTFVINDKLYVGGGYSGTARVTYFYEYDPLTDTWTQKQMSPLG